METIPPTHRPRKSPRARRFAFALAVLLFWLVMVGLLLRREAFLPTVTSTSAGDLRPSESWLAIRLSSGKTVGHAHLRTTLESRDGAPGARFAMSSSLALEMLGQPTTLDLEGWVWRATEVPRTDFSFTVGSADYDFQVVGQIADGTLRGEVISAGETVPLEFPVEDRLLFGAVPGAVLELPKLEVGEVARLETFDPLSLGRGTARLECLAHETLDLAGQPIATRHLLVSMSGFESHAWIDEEGQVVRAETPVGLVVERADSSVVRRIAQAEEGTTPGSGETDDDLLALTAIVPTGQRPFRGARAMTVRLTGIEGRTVPEDSSQRALGGGRYQLLADSSGPGTATGTDVEAPGPSADPGPDLEADAFVQSNHPVVRDRAESIVTGEDDPWQRALLLYEWVFTQIDKEPVLAVPSALEVLETRRGDCNEHTVLYTALARSVGLPTRIAIGVVWSDDLEGFYYHAWPKVLVDGVWRRLDPTLGQPVADATHLELLEGGIERWPQLLPYLGRLEIEIEAAE